jgi:hypothetical protein
MHYHKITKQIINDEHFKFTNSFPDEKACITHFKVQREQEGIICPRWWRQRTSLAKKQAKLRMQTLPQSAVFADRNRYGTHKIAVSVLAHCDVLSHLYEKVIFSLGITTAVGTQTLSAGVETMQ